MQLRLYLRATRGWGWEEGRGKEPSGDTGRYVSVEMRTQERPAPESRSGSKTPLPLGPESQAEKNKGLCNRIYSFRVPPAVCSLLPVIPFKGETIDLSPLGRWKASFALFGQLTVFLWLTTSTAKILFSWVAFSKPLQLRIRRSRRKGERLQQLLPGDIPSFWVCAKFGICTSPDNVHKISCNLGINWRKACNSFCSFMW